jgi:hypothetical protein
VVGASLLNVPFFVDVMENALRCIAANVNGVTLFAS